MLLEYWEQLRGYDKWVQTQATIERSDVTKSPVADRSGHVVGYTYDAGDVIRWTDQNGENQYATFEVEETSPLFQLIDGETVSIRYDPAHPDRFYYRDLLRSRVQSACRTIVGTICVLGLLIFFGWARSH